MSEDIFRFKPGQVRDAILHVLSAADSPLSTAQIEQRVEQLAGPTPPSSIRSYLRLNTPGTFARVSRGVYSLQGYSSQKPKTSARAREDLEAVFRFKRATLVQADCLEWLSTRNENSIHAVVTDPPYGLHEYSVEQQEKLRSGSGGVWRIPPSFDGHTRSPLPRFTTLTGNQLEGIRAFFLRWGALLLPRLVPGAHVVVASNPLFSHILSSALADAGLERRGEIVRLTMTMRGGDRPKNAHEEFSDVSVMPRSMWEPWIVFRKPLEGRVQDNLRRWKTGGFRRPSNDRPFGDVIESSPTRASERKIAPHPSLKPQQFMRTLVRAVLPLGEGVVLDTFAGSGSTLAAAEAVGYESIGIEKDSAYFELAQEAIPALSALKVNEKS